MGRSQFVGGVCFAAAMCVITAACGSSTPATSDLSLPTVVATAYVTIVPITTTTTLPPVPTTPPPYGSISSEAQTHTIVAGDSFGKIAGQYGITIDAILVFNQFADSSQLLLPGAAIGIPPGARVPGTGSGLVPTGDPNADPNADPTTSDVPTGSSVAAATPGSGCTYTIVSGDTPGGVASSYGITFDALQAANPDRDFREWFLVTATINIPAGANC
ncbi:MAG TPA: LysM peptidoglycan-binding domain-containing protein [Ilumatobacter sp.]|nr:LysM peptidoglycan-binding domain-containing protein [Ilumatobacter sp.]